MNGPALLTALAPLMNNDGPRLAVAEAARRNGRSAAARDIAGQLMELAKCRGAHGRRESLEAFC